MFISVVVAQLPVSLVICGIWPAWLRMLTLWSSLTWFINISRVLTMILLGPPLRLSGTICACLSSSPWLQTRLALDRPGRSFLGSEHLLLFRATGPSIQSKGGLLRAVYPD